jgi:monoamine oxidase
MNAPSLHRSSLTPIQNISRHVRIAIIGGGPGGLMTAYLLQKKLAKPVTITIWEADNRIGGKIKTPKFETAPVSYEAGAAEFYDYSPIDGDSLKALIKELGLSITPMGGHSVVVNDRILGNMEDVEQFLGSEGSAELRRFAALAQSTISRIEFYNSQGEESPELVSPTMRFDQFLDQISNSRTRHYIETLIHSDLAAEPHDTNVNYGLHNYVMNDAQYMELYGIAGGNEQLITALSQCLNADIRLNCRVNQVRLLDNGQLELQISDASGPTLEIERANYDYVISALPLSALKELDIKGCRFNDSIQRYLEHFDHPASYLRISVLFERPFWNGLLADSFCMLDQFDGCCLYDESSRFLESKWGVLGWLLGGAAAERLAELSDRELIRLAVESLPSELAFGRSLFVEGKVHRWIGCVNAMPGGASIMPLENRHQPDSGLPNFHVVGDFLFDSTLNGVLESSEYVSNWICAKVNV